jgi:hypothetical protein
MGEFLVHLPPAASQLCAIYLVSNNTTYSSLTLREVSTQVRFEGEQGVDWGGLQVRSHLADSLIAYWYHSTNTDTGSEDWGGLQREFFTVLGRELFDAKVARAGGALFKKMGSESAVLIHPNGEAGAEKQVL